MPNNYVMLRYLGLRMLNSRKFLRMSCVIDIRHQAYYNVQVLHEGARDIVEVELLACNDGQLLCIAHQSTLIILSKCLLFAGYCTDTIRFH